MELFKLLGTIAIDNADANKSLDETSKKGEETQSKLSKALGTVGKGAAAAGKAVMTGLAVGGAAMGTLTVKALGMAGDLEQNMGGSEQVFKEYATSMQETAKNAFSEMGLSTNDYLQTANKMGALFQGAGFSIEESVDLSSSAMQRAADVASIMGIDTSAAMEAIAGAAKGNFTMMDNLGVAMNDTTIQAYALEKGIKKSTSEMTNQEKIGLAMEMFMDKTAYAAGNYARENETLAGSLGTAKSALSNFLDGSGDVDQLVTAFSNAANVIVDNIKTVAPRLINGIVDIVNQIIPMLPPLLNQLLPTIIEGAVALVNGLVQAMPVIMQALMNAMPMLIDGFMQLMGAVSLALPQIIQPIIDSLPTVIINLVNALMNNLPALITGCIQLIAALVGALPQILSALWTALKNVFNTLVKNMEVWFKPAVEWFKEAWDKIKTTVTNAINNVKSVISKGMTTIKTNISNVWSNVKSTVSNTFDSIKSKITTVINGIKSTVTTVFNAIRDAMSKPIEKAKTLISSIVDKIKSIFSKLNIKFPDIKLPHFAITPKGWKIGDLLKGKIPSLGIDWYAKAMNNPIIMTKPTVFGYNAATGTLQAGGEKGSEVVSGTDTLMNMISAAVASQNNGLIYYTQKIIEILATYFPQVIESMDRDFVFNDGVVAARLAPAMNAELGKLKIRKDRGR